MNYVCKDEYYKYAEEFWGELNRVFDRDKKEYLPIVFINAETDNRSKNNMGYTSIHQNDITGLSSMFPVVFVGGRFDDNQVLDTIRHEVIHYFLGIHYRNYSDDTALFHLVCLLFDGKEYKELDHDEKEKYEMAKPYFIKGYDVYKSNDSKAIRANMALLLSLIDEIPEKITIEKAKLCLKHIGRLFEEI